MFRKTTPRNLGWLVALLASLTQVSASNYPEPYVSPDQVQLVREMPYGVRGQAAVMLRDKHIGKVQFYGNGVRSTHGFVYQNGLIRNGVWMALMNRGDQAYGTVRVGLAEPMDVNRYNSIIIWVRANHVGGQKIWVGLQDKDWSEPSISQVRTEPVPPEGLKRAEIYQLVLPFLFFDSERRLDKSRIDGIVIEFGSQTVGNKTEGIIDVLGMAFVKQDTAFMEPQFQIVESPKIAAAPKEKVVPAAMGKKEPVRAVVPPASPKAAEIKTVKKFPPVEAAPASAVVPVPSPKPPIPQVVTAPAAKIEKPEPTPSPHPVEEKNIEPEKVNASVPTSSSPIEKIHENAGHQFWFWFAFFLIGLAGVAGRLLWLRKKPSTEKKERSNRIFCEIRYPGLMQGGGKSFEPQEYWSNLIGRGVRLGWLSMFQSPEIKPAPGDFYSGETFMKENISSAKQAGFRLFPNLCFVRTLFQYETFLTNPQVYLTKPVPQSDYHYSDEELRINHIGYFPVWIPPVWQKRHHLPERLLVAYGKMPGLAPTTDSAQFDLTSPSLRRYSIQVLEKLAPVATGVRIEGAAALLNSVLRRTWSLPPRSRDTVIPADHPEFWTTIIAAIKGRYPNFVFVADGVGMEYAAIRNVGFDFFENNYLKDVLINEIRLGETSRLNDLLKGSMNAHLERSIHNISSLVNANAGPLFSRQNKLGAILLSLMPGLVQSSDLMDDSFSEFLYRLSSYNVLNYGQFSVLETQNPHVFAFVRWDSRSICVAVANFSQSLQSGTIDMSPCRDRLRRQDMYLFSDLMFGSPIFHDGLTDNVNEPAVAVMGKDLKDRGLPYKISGLSLRLFSVNLTNPVAHESVSKLHQLR